MDTTETTCHCGKDFNGSDHCSFCFCEQYEGTCDKTFHPCRECGEPATEGDGAARYCEEHADLMLRPNILPGQNPDGTRDDFEADQAEAAGEQAREQLDVARDLYEQFKEAFQALGRTLERSGNPAWSFEARRMYAYMPNYDTGYDWGMGHNADHWFDEIERVIEGREEDDE